MKASLLLFLQAAFAAASQVANNEGGQVKRKRSCVDKCYAGVAGSLGDPPQNSRLADCAALNVVTLIPPVVYVTTSYVLTTVVTTLSIDQTMAIYTSTITDYITGDFTSTGYISTSFTTDSTEVDPLRTLTPSSTTTTIMPTATPAYASYCTNSNQYYSACERAGVTQSTTTEAPLTSPIVYQTLEEALPSSFCVVGYVVTHVFASAVAGVTLIR